MNHLVHFGKYSLTLCLPMLLACSGKYEKVDGVKLKDNVSPTKIDAVNPAKAETRKYLEWEKSTVFSDSITINGISIIDTKKALLGKFGEPQSTKDPSYECGGFSEGWQGCKFLQYYYDSTVFITFKDQSVLEKHQPSHSKYDLMFYGIKLNNQTKIEELDKILRFKNLSEFKDSLNFISISIDSTDDQIELEFREGKFIKYGYFTPC